MATQPCSIPAPKNTSASIEKLAKVFEILFYKKKFEKEFDKLTFGNSMFVKCAI
jgi:hypothetical protein